MYFNCYILFVCFFVSWDWTTEAVMFKKNKLEQLHYSRFNHKILYLFLLLYLNVISLLEGLEVLPTGSLFFTVHLRFFSFFISQYKNRKVSFWEIDFFSQFLITAGKMRVLCCGWMWHVLLLFRLVCCQWASFHFSVKKRHFIVCNCSLNPCTVTFIHLIKFIHSASTVT